MLFKLSTRLRGTGNVGEMSALINQAFEIVAQQAGKSKFSVLVIDEADSLASSRNVTQSHHEDKVAVNTLIQKIDDVRRFNGRVLVIFSTNRFNALDPAIVRRAARIEEFKRPNDVERRELFKMDCEGLGFDDNTIDELVKLTGSKRANDVPYTFSDLRTRLIPEALAHAYPQRKIEYDDFAAAAKKVVPSPTLV
jgi:SpoVK/Ycf46/Vps4 family AAA+-type ATPase